MIKKKKKKKIIDIWKLFVTINLVTKVNSSITKVSRIFFPLSFRQDLRHCFKSRNITWPTKVHIVKTTVFPVVMYRCDSWTIKKTELPKN